MIEFDVFVLARAIHVLAVVLWIGGVAFVITVFIPALIRLPEEERRFTLFETLEGKFGFQAKWTTAVTGITGIYMLEFLNAWNRYLYLEFWWLHLMTFVWIIFTLVLFVFEPLFLHRWFHLQAENNSDKAFRMLLTMHRTLLSLSLLAVFGAVAGSHGFQFFQ